MPTIFSFVAVITGAIGLYLLCINDIVTGLAALLVASSSLGYGFVLTEIKEIRSPT